MNEIMTLMWVSLSGVLLGAIFFGGLWWTVRKGVSSKQPALWFIGSLLLRMSIVLAGFYFIAHDHWERLLLCLLGFVLARLIMTVRLRSGQARLTRTADKSTYPTQGASNAS